ncbi:hypothetical protein L1987_11928 [Smallanthus sonchifolius]|uniref:Uncharacterized protein n=1 Tax=Smallanthus sonchifolius TaxID=185202 RepID=A0ACB9JEG0_9ASTR|nr:hypothetical protein L1987_11928 [Smallanthus sonchifolius]
MFTHMILVVIAILKFTPIFFCFWILTLAKPLLFTKVLTPKVSLMMAANKVLKVEEEQGGPVTSPPSGGLGRQGSITRNNCLCSPTTHAGSFRCRLHRTHSGIQRTKTINSESKTNDHN